MGKKEWATKIKPTSTRREETPKSPPPREERAPSPQPPESTPQAPIMVSLDAMAEFLRLQDPNRDWAAALAGFSQMGGKGSMTGGAPSEPNVQSMVQPTVYIPISTEIPPERKSPSVTVPPESSEPSQTSQQSDSMEVDPISSHYDSDSDEREARKSREQGSLQGDDEPEKTSAAGTVSQGTTREEIDLNETAKKQGLMTDDEFRVILDGVNQREDDTATMVENLNLTCGAVGEDEEGRVGEKELESVNPQTEAGKSDVHVEAEETEARPEGLDLASKSVGHEEQRIDNARTSGETGPTTQDTLSTQAEKEPEEEKDEDDGEEARYQERKRKGKAPVKKNPSSKRQRTFNTGVVITEATQRTPPNRRESSDNDYTASDESESDSDTSMEDE
ncbi:chromodomain-helicase-DNA-binding protein Mi-2 homolog [Salvia splendens]|uniref:chromodomain-helicase-DNA-binding protein Mi-2 homolog n=1 Tax=Salvia splendens TaxID=180675 RepID=UPI001C2574D3|nr:chromodomain-helicase-DNA-binding protein Mi-2 homolog [Salvia splendens]